MDRPRRRSRLLIAGALSALLTVGVASAASLGAANLGVATLGVAPPLRAIRWLAPGADAAAILTRRPVECLHPPNDPEAAWRVEVGRAAFRSPLLLGGEAARVGVACETCHRSGRTNPDFAFPGVSGAPGTADVTSFVFSSHRGDHVDDPRPIPDLGGPKARLKVPQTPDTDVLETFIHGLVTEEFDGHEPPPAVLAGLAAYVRALGPAACPSRPFDRDTADLALEDVRRAARAAQGALERQDPATAAVMIQAARARLGEVAERYAPPDLALEHEDLLKEGRDLAAVLDAIRAADPAAAARLSAWRAAQTARESRVRAAESRSLYNPSRLARLIAAAGGGR